MWAAKLLLTRVKIRIFGPETSKFGKILAFLAHLLVPSPTKKQCKQGAQVVIPLCRLFGGGSDARAVSRKTPIYFIFILGNNACSMFIGLVVLFVRQARARWF